MLDIQVLATGEKKQIHQHVVLLIFPYIQLKKWSSVYEFSKHINNMKGA